jgi:hypothetical protein
MNITATATSSRSRTRSEESVDAVTHAAALWRQPVMARSAHKYASVEGILPLIRMAAGDPEMLTEYDGTLGLNVEEWQNASVFYLQTILSRKSVEDVYGVLGLPKGASLDLVRVHRRWLSKWLHPDRNPNQWEAALFLKVQKAAQIIEGNKLLLLVSDKTQEGAESK